MRLSLAVSLFCALICNGAIFPEGLEKQVRILEGKIHVLEDILHAKCPDYKLVRQELVNHKITTTTLKVQKILYARLEAAYNACLKEKLKKITTIVSGKESATTPKATPPSSTTVLSSTMIYNLTTMPTKKSKITTQSPAITQTTTMSAKTTLPTTATSTPKATPPTSTTVSSSTVMSNFTTMSTKKSKATTQSSKVTQAITMSAKRPILTSTFPTTASTTLTMKAASTTTTAKSTLPPSSTMVSTTNKEAISISTASQLLSSTVPELLTTTGEITTESVTALACRNAKNLSETWRMDHVGSDIKPDRSNASLDGYACDNRFKSQWFRFAGAAGSQLLDKCPKWKSCGANTPIWTDDSAPKAIGIPTYIDINLVYKENCKWRTHSGLFQVMRCSWNTYNDFIYRLNDGLGADCQAAFCGMED